jgi:hypothetical protein
MSRIIEQWQASGETMTRDELARISPMAFSHISPTAPISHSELLENMRGRAMGT